MLWDGPIYRLGALTLVSVVTTDGKWSTNLASCAHEFRRNI